MMKDGSVKIEYGNLYAERYDGGETVRLPINNLPQMEEADAEHIHGRLIIRIGDEKLSHLGFFGDDDVCFIDWIGVLSGVVECFSTSPQSRFLYCSGEQGDPAFEFCRDNEAVSISYVDTEVYYSILSAELFDSRRANPEKSAHHICKYTDFDFSVRAFIEQIKKEICFELVDFGEIWWELNIHPDGRCSNIRYVNEKLKALLDK